MAAQFSVGDRVEYRDPEDPRNPLTGRVIDVSAHAVRVQYDQFPPSAHPGLIGTEAAQTVLRQLVEGERS